MTSRVHMTGALLGLVLATGIGCQTRAAMLREIEARRLAADLVVAFTKASEATNRAVMADTDEASEAAATLARQSSGTVQQQLDRLDPLIAGLGYQPESESIKTFRDRFTAYRTLEEKILALAVENTNLKAQRLSLTTAADRADTLVRTVDDVAATAPNDWRLRALSAQVASDVRLLQVLQAPHIVEPEDASMTKIEARMADAERQARQRLGQLAAAAPAHQATVARAVSELDAFMTVHRDILGLSRRNTNVRSLALALNEKGALTQACEETLRQLGQQLDGRTSYGSR